MWSGGVWSGGVWGGGFPAAVLLNNITKSYADRRLESRLSTCLPTLLVDNNYYLNPQP